MPKPVEFFFDFASTYSYLSAMRLDAQAQVRDVETVWRPFLLGPIFGAQGWTTSPFNLYPAKGENMWRDMERRAAKYQIAFNRPQPGDGRVFPQNSVLAARMALVGLKQDWGRDFCRAVYTAQFAQGGDISDQGMLSRLAREVGAEGDIADKAVGLANKTLLRVNTDRAIELGIYGAPSFVVGEELFWGDDRLEDALDWAARG